MLDFHTHNIHASDALICVSPSDFVPEDGKTYTVGIHPWDSEDGDVEAQWAALEAAVGDNRVVAIGETGLDSLKGAPMDVQQRLLEQHIALAEQVNKPLVIHMVRTSQPLLKAWRASKQSVAWAIHGFRANERVVAPLVEAGFYISFGERFNAEALKAVPQEQLLVETDESTLAITQIVESMAAVLQMPYSSLETVLKANLLRFLGRD